MSPSLLMAPHGHGHDPVFTPRRPTVPAAVPLCPALAPCVELLGAMPGTEGPERSWLLRYHDHLLHLTELLYRIAACADGAHTLEDIAAEVTERTDWLVSAENVRHLLETRLMPLGLIAPVAKAEAVPQAPVAKPWLWPIPQTCAPRRVYYV